MASTRMNVLVYSGTGSTIESVRHCIYSLRRLLSPNYAVFSITGETIIKEPWLATCALLVFPGGADLGYCRTLNSDGNRRIRQYVNAGGSYLGFCAGGYYGSKRCEFEVGDDKLEVVGDRELDFFPGICRGSAFPGFVYNSERGTTAAELKVEKQAFISSAGGIPEVFRCYFNGGSVFVDAEKLKDRGVQVLANYTQDLSVDPGKGAAAVVYCKVGEGDVILTGPHPEFAAVNLNKNAKDMKPEVVDAIAEDDKLRKDFLKACLNKLGLITNPDEQTLPSLSRIHISSATPSDMQNLLAALEEAITLIDGEKYIKAEVDTFHLEQRSTIWSMAKLAQTVTDVLPSSASSSEEKGNQGSPDAIVDYEKIIKKLVTHDEPPSAKSTPYFNHQAFFSNLATYASAYERRGPDEHIFGSHLMYGEVVTSTSTLLEKNHKLTNTLPTGTTFTATTQLSGRGRGSNVWISPAGSLMFSTVLRHPLSLNVAAPVVFIQYLAALAVAEGIQTYDSAESPLTCLTGSNTRAKPQSRYRRVPVKLKWPNDIYALDPAKPAHDPTPISPLPAADPPRSAYTKIGGILVNSSYSGGDYTLIVGIGLNVSNAAPTTSLNALVEALNRLPATAATAAAPRQPVSPYTPEKLLARILATFQALYDYFRAHGFAGALERLYYKHWLHEGQVVTLETEGGARARIKGVTTDWGLLLAEEVVSVAGGREVGNGRTFALQSDSNSFDFFRGLVKRKV